MKAMVFAILLSVQMIGTAAAGSVIEFSGYSSIGTQQWFVISDVTAKKNSGWLKLGETWEGCTLIQFELEQQSLIVEQNGQRQSKKLRVPIPSQTQLLPTLLTGSFEHTGDSLRYSADAVLRLSTDSVASATRGRMLYNAMENVLHGDLTIDTPERRVIATGARITLKDGGCVIEADAMKMMPKPPRSGNE